ncbi:hypothetical protein WMY93_031693, partial [Mugilogobius chulae]
VHPLYPHRGPVLGLLLDQERRHSGPHRSRHHHGPHHDDPEHRGAHLSAARLLRHGHGPVRHRVFPVRVRRRHGVRHAQLLLLQRAQAGCVRGGAGRVRGGAGCVRGRRVTNYSILDARSPLPVVALSNSLYWQDLDDSCLYDCLDGKDCSGFFCCFDEIKDGGWRRGRVHIDLLDLDSYSRVFFPTSFLLFNIVYWVGYLYL